MDNTVIRPLNIIEIHVFEIEPVMAKNKKNHSVESEEYTESRKKIHDLYEENEYLSIKQNQNRARSITVGTAFGGVVEINVRSDIASIHAQMQPTEAIELIEQLAAGVGVEIAMRPKVNFASWRGWEEVIDQRIGWDKIGWKGTAAWQLGGNELEKNHQLKELETPKKLSFAKEKKTTKKPLKGKVNE